MNQALPKSFEKTSKAFKTQFALNFSEKIIVDFFAGGGGASTGLEMGLNRPVYVAVNHNPKAVAMHAANHPHTIHYVQDVFAVDPVEICDGYQVGWFHASPDCTHHSQAAGGQPRKKEIRDLSWVVIKFAGKTKPDVITLENVKQILNWGPLIAKRDKATGRVITLDKVEVKGKLVNRVAEPGERVPRNNQFLIPNPKKKGKTWRHFVRSLEKLGYVVEWNKRIIAADFGAPTTRERLFLIARCDGQPIVWTDATHFKKAKRGQEKWRSAAECIDFSDLGNSIFERSKPLADATLKRIARGLQKYVIESKKPFFVNSAVPFIGRDFGTSIGHSIEEPLARRAGYSTHSAYSNVVINEGISNHLKQVFKDEANLNPKAFSVRVRLLKDESGGFPPESLKRIIINPYNRIQGKGFVLCMIYEGFFFELFCNASTFKDRQAPGFLNRAKDSFFVPYVDLFDIPEVVQTLADGLKIHNETPDENKIKI
ncbi:DNA cytosine methyltransferase [Acinetobacter pittii]|uniref:DNA cytosine methyltransferase n=1 Tax=Acinetobacter pittii TaxID=48296 RepID=UPI00355C9313